KWLRGTPFLAHEHEGRHRREQRDRERRLDRGPGRERVQALSERPVSDLVVILQKADKGGRRQARGRLAAASSVSMRRRLALIGEAGGQSARELRAGRILVVAIISAVLVGQQHVPGVVLVVLPLGP